MSRKKGAAVGGPWYDAGKDLWRVTDRGVTGRSRPVTVRDHLGRPVRGADNRAAAVAALQGGGATPPPCRLTVGKLLSAYLEGEGGRLKPATLATYRPIFDDFTKFAGPLAAEGLSPVTLKRWLERHRTWNPSTRHLAGSVVKAAFAWAAAAGRGRLIAADPLKGFRLPTVRRRPHDCVVTREQFETFLGVAPQPLKNIMTVAWETGTRPVNLSRAKVSDFRPTLSALVLDDHKTAGKTGRPLIIPLTGTAVQILYERTKEVGGRDPAAHLFVSPTGLPWNRYRLGNMVNYYARKVGLAGRLTAYSCRHSLATRLLSTGVPLVDVAAILGNTPAVVARHYSHVAADTERLRRILEGGGPGDPPGPPPLK